MARSRVAARPHGVNKYKTEGCRCDECRQSVRDLERRRRRTMEDARVTRAPVICGCCGDEIEHCDGAETDWMHTSTRGEHCADGRLAVPETVAQYDARARGARRAS